MTKTDVARDKSTKNSLPPENIHETPEPRENQASSSINDKQFPQYHIDLPPR